MRRWVALTWHASFSVVAGVLYYFFVLPRFPELTGSITHTVGTALRIVTALVIGLAALPVLFTLLGTRRRELCTPRLAWTLRVASIVLHVLAAVLIIGTAVTEIWVTLDSAGRWLFGVYGGAVAVAVLGVFAFWLSFVAELPPPPPKPVKAREAKTRTRRGRNKDADDDADASDEGEVDAEAAEDDATAGVEAEPSEAPAKVTAEEATAESDADAAEPVSTAGEVPALEDEADDDTGSSTGNKLRNRRASGKVTVGKRRRRLRGGVAVED